MPKQSITPFTYYTFRYDYTDDTMVEKIKKYFMRDFPKYALFLEVSQDVNKNHIQGKIGKALSLVQVRKNLLAEFPNVFSKSNYSISDIKKPDEYDSYICKDGNVLCNNVFDDEYILSQKEKHIVLHNAFENKKQKKNATVSFTQKIFQDFCKEYPFDVRDIQCRFYQPTDYEKNVYDKACESLLKFILKRLGDVVKVFDDNVLQRMYNGVKNAILALDDKCSHTLLEHYKNRIQL